MPDWFRHQLVYSSQGKHPWGIGRTHWEGRASQALLGKGCMLAPHRLLHHYETLHGGAGLITNGFPDRSYITQGLSRRGTEESPSTSGDLGRVFAGVVVEGLRSVAAVDDAFEPVAGSSE